jgi:hypothetical protein
MYDRTWWKCSRNNGHLPHDVTDIISHGYCVICIKCHLAVTRQWWSNQSRVWYSHSSDPFWIQAHSCLALDEKLSLECCQVLNDYWYHATTIIPAYMKDIRYAGASLIKMCICILSQACLRVTGMDMHISRRGYSTTHKQRVNGFIAVPAITNQTLTSVIT